VELWSQTPAQSVKNRQRNIDFGICGGQRASKMALGSYNHIGFATSMVLRVLGGLCDTSDDHRLELEH
jgi:hypothetical protein